jgi:cytosine/adenosine deaminase-related metal-dependent hydrolase
MARKRTLLKNGCVLTLDANPETLCKLMFLIEGAKIAAVRPSLAAADAEMIDASNRIVMPGFVDTHRHMWQGALRNIAPWRYCATSSRCPKRSRRAEQRELLRDMLETISDINPLLRSIVRDQGKRDLDCLEGRIREVLREDDE